MTIDRSVDYSEQLITVGGAILMRSKILWCLPLSILVVLFFSETFTKTTSAQVTAGPERPEAQFTNAAPIAIDDTSPANPYPSTINVSGVLANISATPGSVRVTLNGFSHTWPNDVGIVLVGPTGAALLLQDGVGDTNSSMSNVTYTLSDAGSAPLPDLTAWTAGVYKPAAYFAGDSFPAPGPGTAYSNPGPAGGGTSTFSSTFGGTNPNGAWKLYVVDFVTGDTGMIAGGWTLEFPGIRQLQHVVDFNGDGKTDWSVIRQASVSPNAQATWYNCYNGVPEPACFQSMPFGLASDVWIPADFDGDGKSDIAVWRKGAPFVAGFYIVQSMDNTLRFEQFGQDGDDPTVTADYTGDHKADPAVFRQGVSQGSQSYFFYRASSGPFATPGSTVYEPWGTNDGPTLLGDYPVPGDFDGDGKSDFMVARNDGTGRFVFWLRTNGTNTVSTFLFGLSGDVNTLGDTIVPGDYDGDGITDIAVVRGVGAAMNWYVRRSSNPTAEPFLASFGSFATDFPVQGDYDGDGITDVAVWRPSTITPPGSVFHVLGSMSGYKNYTWGLCQAGPPVNCDVPTANYNSH